MRPRLALVLAVAASLIAALTISACGDEPTGIADIQAVDADCGSVQYAGSSKAQKLIVSDLPLKGDSAERSRQMNAAIIQTLARKGWQAGTKTQLAFQACDDSLGSTGEWDEGLCRSNAQAYASNPDVIGVIGTYNSGCAAIEMPILNQAPGGAVPMVSPGNTFVCLTQPSPTLCAKDEPDVYFPSGKRNYIRVVPNDAVQGAGLASFADSIGVTKPFVLIAADDPTSAGQGLTFTGAARSLGMQIAGTERFDPNAQSDGPLMQKVKASGADAVVLASILEQNGVQLIRDKVATLGPNDGAVKLLAFDGFGQQATLDNTGPAAKGMYASLPGKVPSALTGPGDVFVKEMRAQIPSNPIEVFAPYAGQAAAVLVDAIREGQTRSGTIDELFKTRVQDGITGSFVITPTGDPEPAPISVQRADRNFVLARTITPPPQLVSAARGG
ncbi:MAG TPA: branched-chain amino acid ABC transporter substrate-binding protein [Solirubrobacterales bacterium]|nr:branched-chain amino acid ABC transporter substrate-binding protein [Solirubrobacterales bacterium]